MKQENTNRNTEPKGKESIVRAFIDTIPKLFAAIITTAMFGKEWQQVSFSSIAAAYYEVPRYYFYDESIYGFLIKILGWLFPLIILLVPFILKKLREKPGFKLTKFEHILFTLALFSVVLALTANVSSKVVEIINISNVSLIIILSTFVPIMFSILWGVKVYVELGEFVKSIKIKKVKKIGEPREGYKLITFDFNGGRKFGKVKKPVEYEVSVGSKISELVNCCRIKRHMLGTKKGRKRLTHWTGENGLNTQYSDEVITENFKEKHTIWAQYSEENSRKPLGDRLKFSFEFIIVIFTEVVIIVSLFAQLYRTSPSNKTLYEVVPYGEKDSKVIVGHYNGDAILMDYDPVDIPQSNVPGIKLKVGKFYIDSVNGKKIEMEHYITLEPERNKESQNPNP